MTKKKKYGPPCNICGKGNMPFANISGGANCHAECYRRVYGEIDNARAITSMARGYY